MLPPKIELPPHAYVPGQTARHPEGWFEGIKADVSTGTPIEQTQAWQAGLLYLDAGFYWECHEVLEAVWLFSPNPSPDRDMTQAIIQLANARLKIKMNKPKAALRLCKIVDDLLDGHSGPILGLDIAEVSDWANETRDSLMKFDNLQ